MCTHKLHIYICLNVKYRLNRSCGDNAVLYCSQPPDEEVDLAVASLKKGKSAGIDNIPAKFVQAGEKTVTDVLTEICNRILRSGEQEMTYLMDSVAGSCTP